MNQDQIEQASITVMNECLNRSSKFKSLINSNDKTPFLDGKILLYNIEEGETTQKTSFDNEIQVQIKGTTDTEFLKTKKYRIESVDLQAYKKIGGVIFFVVYIEGYEGGKIFYKEILPFDLKNINFKQRSYQFDFYELPIDTKKIYSILDNS